MVISLSFLKRDKKAHLYFFDYYVTSSLFIES